MKTLLFLLPFSLLTYKSQSQQAKRIECPQLQISFLLPSAFTSLGDTTLDKLDKRGRKAIKEEFNNDQVLGWQKGCITLGDSLKRTIIVTHLSVKEAIKQDGSVKNFIEKTYEQANEFIIRRFETKTGITFRKDDLVKQSTITIAGYPVRKNAVTVIYNNALLLFTRYYFFEKNGRLYLLSLTAGKAVDNEQVEKALESAVNM